MVVLQHSVWVHIIGYLQLLAKYSNYHQQMWLYCIHITDWKSWESAIGILNLLFFQIRTLQNSNFIIIQTLFRRMVE